MKRKSNAEIRESYRLRTIKRLATIAKKRAFMKAVKATRALDHNHIGPMARDLSVMGDRSEAQLKRALSAIQAGSAPPSGTVRDVADSMSLPSHHEPSWHELSQPGARAIISNIQDPADTEPGAVQRIVNTLADSHDLADVLAAIRDKVQRLSDEGHPHVVGGDMRESLISQLSRCVRLARRTGWDGTAQARNAEETKA
jgi:hypothetical protein